MMKQNTQKQSGRSSCWRGILFLAIMLTAAVFFYGCSLGDGQSDQASLQSEEDLTAYFLDVGQADSTLLVSQGEAVLIDAGNRDDAEFILGYIKHLGFDHLKYVIFTHPHEDHIGSGRNVLQQFGADTVYMLDGYDSGIAGSLKQSIDQLGIQTKAPTPGDTAAFGECEIQFLGPYEKYNDTNDNSICLKVKHGETSMLFTGDAGSSPEKKMIEMGGGSGSGSAAGGTSRKQHIQQLLLSAGSKPGIRGHFLRQGQYVRSSPRRSAQSFSRPGSGSFSHR